MLVAEINRGNFEYDVHAILQAFYPEEQVRVLTPETGEEKRAALRQEKDRIQIRLHPEGAVIALEGQEYSWNWPEDEAGGDSTLVSEKKEAPALVSDGEEASALVSEEKEVLEPASEGKEAQVLLFDEEGGSAPISAEKEHHLSALRALHCFSDLIRNIRRYG